jgi:ribosomal protein S14
MAKLLAVAQRELEGTDLAALYRRFLTWTLEPDRRCAICGSRRHAVLPGVPPRLVPCNALRGVAAASDLPGVTTGAAVGGGQEVEGLSLTWQLSAALVG